MPNRLNHHPARTARTAAFTLIELMISIAIVLILMLGINYVFSMSSRTISTGMAVSAVGRDMRNARRVLESDFANTRNIALADRPALIIHNEIVYAWRDRQDKLTDADGDPTTYDIDGEPGDEVDLSPGADPTGLNPDQWTSGVPGPYGQLPGVYNHRRHRVDRLSFFTGSAEEPFKRQTGDNNTYIGTDTSDQAWVQYGLLRLADNSGVNYWKPGARNLTGNPQDEAANHNNFFASQWTLGRRLMLLLPYDGTSSIASPTAFIPAAGGSLGLQFGAEASQKTTTGIQNFNRENPPYATSTRWRVEESRVDLVAVTTFGTAGTGSAVQRMRARFDPALVGGLQWWLDADPTTTTAGTNRDRRIYTDTPPATTVNYLPWAKPYIDKSNFATSLANQTREAALTHPIFLRGVSQFIVEFAGDFFDQGNIDAAGTPEGLGTIDYVPLPGGGSQVRWYGMPRDSNGDAVVGAFDVQPVSIPPPPSPFGGSGVASRFNVAATPPAVIPGATGMQKPRSTGTLPYIFAWGPVIEGQDPVAATATAAATPGHYNNVRPSLVRVTLELIDANGRLADGQRIEYIFKLE